MVLYCRRRLLKSKHSALYIGAETVLALLEMACDETAVVGRVINSSPTYWRQLLIRNHSGSSIELRSVRLHFEQDALNNQKRSIVDMPVTVIPT